MDMKKITLEMTKIERDSFLRKTLSPYVPSEKVEKIIKSDCVMESVDCAVLENIAKELVRNRCFYVAGLSMSTSLSGVAGTMLLLPLDCVQFAYHAMKLSQELYFLYGTKNMFTYKSKDELELLVYLLAGAGGAISFATTSLSAIGQKLYQAGMSKLHLRALSTVPYIGGVIHGSLSAYALYSLALEYIERLQAMVEEKVETTPAQVAKEIGTFIDVEYHVAEEKLRSFCNLEKLREYYQYMEAGYLSEEEFEQLKLDL